MIKRKAAYVLWVFVLETFLQTIYYAVVSRYFTPFEQGGTPADAFKDFAYALFLIKSCFFLPVYGLYYFFIATKFRKYRTPIGHALLFLVSYFLLIFVFSLTAIGTPSDLLLATLLSFLSAFVVGTRTTWSDHENEDGAEALRQKDSL